MLTTFLEHSWYHYVYRVFFCLSSNLFKTIVLRWNIFIKTTLGELTGIFFLHHRLGTSRQIVLEVFVVRFHASACQQDYWFQNMLQYISESWLPNLALVCSYYHLRANLCLYLILRFSCLSSQKIFHCTLPNQASIISPLDLHIGLRFS